MTYIRSITPTRMLAAILPALLFAILPLQPSAQTAQESRAQHPVSFGYDKAHEITLNGVVQEVVSKRVTGSPFGMHVLVASSQGTVDAHFGPYLAKDTKQALRAGERVQIVGAMQKLRGANYLLARELILGGRTITVRSENGFLVRPHAASPKAENRQEKTATVAVNDGGAR